MMMRRTMMTMPAMTQMCPRSAARAGRAASGRCVRRFLSRHTCECVRLCLRRLPHGAKEKWPQMQGCWVQTPQLPPYQQSPYQQQGMYPQQPGMPYPQQPGPGIVPMPQPSYNGAMPSSSGPGVYEDTPDGYTRPGAGQRTSARGGRKVSYKVSAEY